MRCIIASRRPGRGWLGSVHRASAGRLRRRSTEPCTRHKHPLNCQPGAFHSALRLQPSVSAKHARAADPSDSPTSRFMMVLQYAWTVLPAIASLVSCFGTADACHCLPITRPRTAGRQAFRLYRRANSAGVDQAAAPPANLARKTWEIAKKIKTRMQPG
jgi:hypothetical protein